MSAHWWILSLLMWTSSPESKEEGSCSGFPVGKHGCALWPLSPAIINWWGSFVPVAWWQIIIRPRIFLRKCSGNNLTQRTCTNRAWASHRHVTRKRCFLRERLLLHSHIDEDRGCLGFAGILCQATVLLLSVTCHFVNMYVCINVCTRHTHIHHIQLKHTGSYQGETLMP